MKTLNRVQLIGRIGQEPKIHSSQPDKETHATLNICTITTRKNNEEELVWHKLVGFSGIIPIIKGFKKGDRIFVEGMISNSQYVDANGNKQYSSCIIIHHCHKTDPMVNLSTPIG